MAKKIKKEHVVLIIGILWLQPQTLKGQSYRSFHAAKTVNLASSIGN
jgi:hypothetical protein